MEQTYLPGSRPRSVGSQGDAGTESTQLASWVTDNMGFSVSDYSVYVMRQASRRSWRIGQTRPVKVVFMSYRNTLQADALKLVAKKLQSSLAVEGELPEDGLAAYGDDGDDLMMALARKIVSGEEEDAETMEEVFAQARDTEATAEEYLLDDDWKVVDVEPEMVAVNGNGHHANGNGHETIGIGPTVELVLGNGHHPNGNGHHDEAPEPQQSLFSWAEFMAEGPQEQAATRRPLDVRVRAQPGARAGAGRRETLDRNTQGEEHRDSVFLPLRGHVCGPFCVSGPGGRGSLHSVNRWLRPRSLASSSSAIMCFTLGRTRPSAQRHTVERKVPMRRAISDHDRPDSSWNRFSRSGKSSGKS